MSRELAERYALLTTSLQALAGEIRAAKPDLAAQLERGAAALGSCYDEFNTWSDSLQSFALNISIEPAQQALMRPAQAPLNQLSSNDMPNAESAVQAIIAGLETARSQHAQETAGDQVGDLLKRIDELEPLVRERAAERASADLAAAYTKQAAEHVKQWEAARLQLVASTALTAVVAVGTHLLLAPEQYADPGEIASSVTFTVLLVGLALYLVRLSAQAYRAHRHLEVTCVQKANALRTFNDMVGMQRDEQVQVAIASTLASYVFSPDQTGFLEDSAEHVTLVERGLASLAPVAQKRAES